MGSALPQSAFRDPTFVSGDGQRNVYVYDQQSREVTVMTRNGTQLYRWGDPGGKTKDVLAMEVDDPGFVYLLNATGVHKFTSAGGFLNTIITTGTGAGQLNPLFIRSMTMNQSGFLFVLESNKIHYFANNGGLVTTFPLSQAGLTSPDRIAIDINNNMFIAENGDKEIFKFSPTGIFIKSWTRSTGQGIGSINQIDGFEVRWTGDIYVADNLSHEILVFNNDGAYITSITQYDGKPLHTIRDIDMATNAEFYISDSNNRQLTHLDSDGTYVSKIEWAYLNNGSLWNPRKIYIDQNDFLYVMDAFGTWKYTLDNKFVEQMNFGSSGTSSAVKSLAVDQLGNGFSLYYNQVQKISPQGLQLKVWGETGTNAGQFQNSGFLALNEKNGTGGLSELWVGDERNGKLLRFDLNGNFIDQPLTMPDMTGTTDLGGYMAVKGTEIYAEHRGSDKIYRYVSLNAPTSWATPASTEVMGLATNADGTIVTSSSDEIIRMYDVTNGNVLKSWGGQGTADGKFEAMGQIASSKAGDVYVIDEALHRVVRFNTIKIDNFTPASATAGATITLTGYNLPTTPTGVTASIGGVNADIVSVDGSGIKIKVPTGIPTSSIAVSYKGLTLKPDNDLVVGSLALTSFTPTSGIAGSTVTITGTGFSQTLSKNLVKFNGVVAEVTAATSTTLTVKVPSGTAPGKISVAIGTVTITSATDFTYIPLSITTTTVPEFYTAGATKIDVSATINDRNAMASGSLKYRRITEIGSPYQSGQLTLSPTTNNVSTSIAGVSLVDPLGMEMFFEITNVNGDVVVSDKLYSHIQHPISSNEQNIDGLVFGSTIADYQLIAFPYDMANKSAEFVFRLFLPYDIFSSRFYAFINGENVEFPGFANVNAGDGYWFIATEQKELNPGTVTAVKATPDSPFKKQLAAGWNLVGNPYPFDINWEDVKAHPGNPQVGNLRQYINGAFVENNTLKAFRAGFVNMSAAGEVAIPIKKASPGRISKTKNTQSIDNPTWTLDLSIDDGSFRNELFAVGMNPSSVESFDSNDEPLLPIVEGISSFQAAIGSNLSLGRNIVAPGEYYAWPLDVNAAKDVTLAWNNEFVGTNKLMIETDGALIDMKGLERMKLPAGQHRLWVHYGSEKEIATKVHAEQVIVGDAIPNPVSRNNGQLSFWASLPTDATINFSLMNTTGVMVTNAEPIFSTKGKKVIDWTGLPAVSAGMYFAKIEIKTTNGTFAFWRKVVVE